MGLSMLLLRFGTVRAVGEVRGEHTRGASCTDQRKIYSPNSPNKESLNKEFDPRSAGAARTPGCAGALQVP